MKIWALAGFLGLPHDWDLLHLQNIIAVDWQTIPLESLTEWGHAFNSSIERKRQGLNILMGYSLGGRLALHALIDQPQLWDAAIIISAHPGLIKNSEEELRKKNDLNWAERFESDNWSCLIGDWNRQDVFVQDSFSLERREADYQRNFLVQAFKGGSLGRQENLREPISSLPMPILWISGSLDHRYCEVARDLVFSHSLSRWKSIEGGGHRVPWSQPLNFSETVKVFLGDIHFF